MGGRWNTVTQFCFITAVACCQMAKIRTMMQVSKKKKRKKQLAAKQMTLLHLNSFQRQMHNVVKHLTKLVKFNQISNFNALIGFSPRVALLIRVGNTKCEIAISLEGKQTWQFPQNWLLVGVALLDKI